MNRQFATRKRFILHCLNEMVMTLYTWEQLLPTKEQTQYLNFKFHANYFLLPWKIHEEISTRFSSKTKSSIYNIKHNIYTTFCHSIRWNRILMFNGSIYNVLYLQIRRFYLVRQHYTRESNEWRDKHISRGFMSLSSYVITLTSNLYLRYTWQILKDICF